MTAERTMLRASLWGLLASVLLGAAATFAPGTPLEAHGVPGAHAAVAVFGFLVPAFTALHLHSAAEILKRPAPPRKARAVAGLWLAGAAWLALAVSVADGPVRRPAFAVAALALTAAAGMTTGLLLGVLPRRGHSVVDVARDPLTKGDDASFTHARFAHFLLPLGVALAAAAGPWWGWEGAWAWRAWLAGLHLLLAGYGLFSCYGLSHLWVPRLSGVPAIAAGAIKGELHSSLLGLLLLASGFATGLAGLAIAGGAFLFLGAFTWMGVLGANIMRNKSRTQRVTPEFVYVPWTFTGVFWLLSGVLLGIFLNVVPELFADRLPGLRFAHAHVALYGGFAQVLVGFATRLLPAQAGLPPLPFQRAKWGFYALNAGLALMVYGRLAGAVGSTPVQAGSLLAAGGLAAAFMTLARHRAKAGGP